MGTIMIKTGMCIHLNELATVPFIHMASLPLRTRGTSCDHSGSKFRICSLFICFPGKHIEEIITNTSSVIKTTEAYF